MPCLTTGVEREVEMVKDGTSEVPSLAKGHLRDLKCRAPMKQSKVSCQTLSAELVSETNRTMQQNHFFLDEIKFRLFWYSTVQT